MLVTPKNGTACLTLTLVIGAVLMALPPLRSLHIVAISAFFLKGKALATLSPISSAILKLALALRVSPSQLTDCASFWRYTCNKLAYLREWRSLGCAA